MQVGQEGRSLLDKKCQAWMRRSTFPSVRSNQRILSSARWSRVCAPLHARQLSPVFRSPPLRLGKGPQTARDEGIAACQCEALRGRRT